MATPKSEREREAAHKGTTNACRSKQNPTSALLAAKGSKALWVGLIKTTYIWEKVLMRWPSILMPSLVSSTEPS